jgi:hypothetical protein
MEDHPKSRPSGYTVYYVLLSIALIIVIVIFIFATMPRGVPDEPPVELRFGVVTVDERTINNTTYWDITTDVIGKSETSALWPEMRVQVVSSDGEALSVAISPREDNTSEYDDGADGLVDIEAWFTCGSPWNHRVDEGDSIKITGLHKDLEGTTIKIRLHEWGVVGSFKVPNLG